MLFEYHSGQRWCCSGLCQTAVFHERWFIYAALWLSASLSHCIQYFGLNVVKSSKLDDEFSMVACYSHMIILVGVIHSTIIVRWEMLASTEQLAVDYYSYCVGTLTVTGCSFQIEVKIKVAHSICLAIEEKFNVILLTAKTFQVKVDTQTFFKVNMHSLTQLDCKNRGQSKVWIHLY